MKTLVFLMLSCAVATAVASDCSHELSGAQKLLGPKHSASTWIETTANDRKPLFIRLSSEGAKLKLLFFKTREGLWAEGPATICPKSKKPKLVAKINKQELSIGSAAPSLIRWGFSDGAEFTLTPNENGELKITTFGWGGTFVPSTDQALADAQAAIKKVN